MCTLNSDSGTKGLSAGSFLASVMSKPGQSLPEDVEDVYPLTRLQLGMIFHNQFSNTLGTYHDVLTYRLRIRKWSVDTLRLVLNALVKKHPILRTSISLTQYAEPVQLVHKATQIPIDVRDITKVDCSAQDKIIAEWIEVEKQHSFDLNTPPLLRIYIHQRNVDTFQYTVSFHHAILDGWSFAALQTELFRLYDILRPPNEKGLVLRPLASSFKQAVKREREALQSEEERVFWKNHLAGYSSRYRWSNKTAVIVPLDQSNY